jgi:hypothetical protein
MLTQLEIVRDRFAALGRASINGLLVTAKHFPGHGESSVDSHHGIPSIDGDLDHLEKFELPPQEGTCWLARLTIFKDLGTLQEEWRTGMSDFACQPLGTLSQPGQENDVRIGGMPHLVLLGDSIFDNAHYTS